MLHQTADVIISATEERESIEIPCSGGARKSKLVTSGDTICFPYEGLGTTWDALMRGQKLSGNGECFGWRNFEPSYSWINYEKFIKRAEAFGSGLVEIGLTPGPQSNVGIYAKNRLEWVIAQYGIWSKSSVIVPLYDTLGPDACTHIIKKAEIKIVICDDENNLRNLLRRRKETPLLKHIIITLAANQELSTLAAEKDIKLHTFDEIENLGGNCSTLVLPPRRCDVALVCFTSGTTGVPKGVPLTHENIVSMCCSLNLVLGKSSITKEDTTLSYLPLAHIFGQLVHVLFLMAGARIAFFSGDTSRLIEDVKILQPTLLPAVPRLLNKWYAKAQIMIRNNSEVDSSNENFTSKASAMSAGKPLLKSLGGKLRIIISGGAPIYKNVVEFYTRAVGVKVFEIYGQTECSGPCTANLLDSYYDGSVGAPLPCCMMKVIDEPDMGYYAKDSKGEVCVKGHNVFKGYLKDPAKTEEALDADGWLHTGDIGMWLPNGKIKIIDRKKNFFKISQGIFAAPEKIENIYAMSPYVSQVYVAGHSLKSFLVAIVIPDKDTVLPWSKENTKCNSWTEVCDDPAIKTLILDDMRRQGKEAGLISFEQVKAIHLHPEVLTYEAGFLTPTSKLKREFCKKYFAKEIETLYSSCKEDGEVVMNQ